jgi:hypothetical protein
MTQPLPEAVQADIQRGFAITDPDHFYQRAKALGDGKYRFKTGYPGFRVQLDDIDYPGAEVDEVVDVHAIDTTKRLELINTYYNDEADFNAAVSLDEREFALAEMIYETQCEGAIYVGD